MTQVAPHDFSRTSKNSSGCARSRRVDVAIVGGGLSGSVLATVLGRAGIRVAVVDLHAAYPPEFKAEKLAGDQIELLRRLRLLDRLTANATPVHETLSARRGKAIDRRRQTEYGLLYQDMVAAARAQLPAAAELVIGRVADVGAGPETQTVTLGDGSTIEARLLAVATGGGGAMRQKLGIERRTIRDGHSLSLGFDVEPAPGARFPFQALTYYGERIADRVDYVSLFPIGRIMRANLFCFRDARDPWTRAFIDDPRRMLLETMPGIGRFLGAFRIPGKAQARVVDLLAVDGHRRDGVVLVGDAFRTTCPTSGTGISKLLTDIECLSRHVPRWLATPGMTAGKIAQFYDDPAKLACDAQALAWSEYRRSITIDPGLGWEMHRRRVYLGRRMRGWLGRLASAPDPAPSAA
jgi:2-polyprenyl-6-methoxyphenol hydroxylase-like FAD-dependent oxidoreductase